MLDIFDDVVEVNGYQKLRAIIATMNNVALMSFGPFHGSHEARAIAAIDAAEALLDQLGIVDPDTVSS